MSNIHESVAALRKAKNESGLEAVAVQAIEDVRNGLRSTWASKLDTIEAVKAIRDESLFHFAKMPNSDKPFAGWKPLVKSIFKAETKDWDKALRNSWAVSLVDLGMTMDEAADALNTSKATVGRACKDAEIEAEGGDPAAAKRAAQESKSDADKLMDTLKRTMGSLTDTTKFTNADVKDMAHVVSDFTAALLNEIERRDLIANSPARSGGGNNPRTGAPATPKDERKSA